MWHPRALKHGRVIESNCNFVLNNKCKPKVQKNNVLDRNGSNESSKKKWAKNLSNNGRTVTCNKK